MFSGSRQQVHVVEAFVAANISGYNSKIFYFRNASINNAPRGTQIDASMNINQLFSQCLRCLLLENERLPLDSCVL